MKVYWTPFNPGGEEWINIGYQEPDSLFKWITEGRNKETTLHLKCYAFIDYLKNTLIIRSPVDYTLKIAPNGSLSSQDFDQEFFDNFVSVRTHPDDRYRSVSFKFFYTFFTDQNLTVELLPMPLDHSQLSRDIRVIPATFDIGQWIRPVEWAFEVLDGVQEIVIRRGDPLFALRFVTDEKIDLERVEQTPELLNTISSCVRLKERVPNTPLRQCYAMAAQYIGLFKAKFKRSRPRCPFHRR